jgi:hypothetical protein
MTTKRILHVESLLFFLLSLFVYYVFDGNWPLFVVLLFTPDISMIGYLKDTKTGAFVYNIVHNYILVAVIILVALLFLQNVTMALIGVILFAHISLDRFMGFGLKEPDAFKSTHLGKIGK